MKIIIELKETDLGKNFIIEACITTEGAPTATRAEAVYAQKLAKRCAEAVLEVAKEVGGMPTPPQNVSRQ